MKVRWEEPPAPRLGRKKDTRTDDEKFADELRKRPGAWAVLTDDAASAKAHQIRSGQVRAFRPDADGWFNAAARQTDTSKPGRARIYVRYLLDNTDGNDE